MFALNSWDINENNFSSNGLYPYFEENKILNIYSPKYLIKKITNFLHFIFLALNYWKKTINL